MARGISLHIGLNAVDPKHYQGWSGELRACEFDARDMNAVAASRQFKGSLLLTKKATRNAVLKALNGAAQALKKDDIFFLTYSGHGGQLPDVNGDENDSLDETWCLYDGELVDDELYAALGKFAPGVRILVLSDSCHSGSVLKASRLSASLARRDEIRYRAMPDAVAQRTYLAHKKFYDNILLDKKIANAKNTVKASGLLISGCQDNQLSGDGLFNGVFTDMLKTVWNGGKFTGNYAKFHKAIRDRMPADQTPNLFKVGAANATFDDQTPFTV